MSKENCWSTLKRLQLKGTGLYLKSSKLPNIIACALGAGQHHTTRSVIVELDNGRNMCSPERVNNARVARVSNVAVMNTDMT